MSNEEIVSQLQDGQGDRQSLLEELWINNLWLIRKIITKTTGLSKSDLEFEDLEQQAFLGILECIPFYDCCADTKFFSLAFYYIRQSIFKYYDRCGQTMRIPAYLRNKIRAFEKERERRRKWGEPDSSEEIGKALGLSKMALRSIERAIQRKKLQSLDDPVRNEDNNKTTVLDSVAGSENTCETALFSVYNKELHEVLCLAIKELPKTERVVIEALYFQGLNRTHIAKMIGCDTQDISMFARSAYRRIRTGKYAGELLTFLPERSIKYACRKIEQDFKELAEGEKDLLI